MSAAIARVVAVTALLVVSGCKRDVGLDALRGWSEYSFGDKAEVIAKRVRVEKNDSISRADSSNKVDEIALFFPGETPSQLGFSFDANEDLYKISVYRPATDVSTTLIVLREKYGAETKHEPGDRVTAELWRWENAKYRIEVQGDGKTVNSIEYADKLREAAATGVPTKEQALEEAKKKL